MSSTPILNRKIKIALVGCGRIAKSHLRAITEHEQHLNLVAICDNSDVVRQAVGEQLGVPVFEELSDMLKAVDIDIVTLCTPSGIHAKQSNLVAAHGRHIITEKPMATHWQDGLQMVETAEQNNVLLFVVKQNRLNPTVRALKQAIDIGRFGKMYTIHANVFWTRPQEYYDQAQWRGTRQFDGGALMNQASHYVDLLAWLGGSISEVQAMTGTLARNIECEDTAVLNLRWQSGAIGSMCVSMLTYPKNFEGSITILGERGTVRLDGLALNQIKCWQFLDKNDIAEVESLSYHPTSVYGNGHGLYYENVINVLRGKSEPISDGRSGLKSLELLIAAYVSAQEKKSIYLPLT